MPLDLPSCVRILAVSIPGQLLHASMARNSDSEQHGALALPGWKLLTCEAAWHKGPEVAQKDRRGHRRGTRRGKKSVKGATSGHTLPRVFSALGPAMVKRAEHEF